MTRIDKRIGASIVLVASGGCARDADPELTAPEAQNESTLLADSGQLSSLIPFHKDAIHSSVMWDGDRDPWLCFWMRPSEYRGSDLVDPELGPLGTLRELFQQLVYGGFGFSNNLDASVRSLVKEDIARDNALCLDLLDPKGLWESGKHQITELGPADFAVNAHALENAGHTLGLNYNLFCSGHAMLSDGRLAVFGGHDKSGNYGIDAVNILDLEDWSWTPRAVPPVKTAYLNDPTNLDPSSHPSALDEQFTDPADPSDMKYQRWYPSAVPLPDGQVLVLSGSDQDSSLPRDEASRTKLRQGVPEIFDPERDRSIALESAHKLLAMYPRSYVVQTGAGRNDWKVAVTGVVSSIPADLSSYDPFPYSGETLFLDVRAALADPDRNTRAENHWSHVATATSAHADGAGAQLWKLDRWGRALEQRVVAFGGDSGAGSDEVATVEMIDYSAAVPKWEVMEPLAQPVRQNLAVALADGTVLVLGGRGGSPTTNNLQLQLFDPDTGRVTTVGTTPVPRHDHSTALLLPDASVLIMGGNRVQLVPGNANAGLPVAEVYRPPYLFRGHRPVISDTPKEIEYDSRFEIELKHKVDVKQVTLVRTGPVTHNWDWGNRHVSLAFRQDGKELRVTAPRVPGLAVPGDYMLFVLDDRGVPSKAEVVRLRLD